MLRLLNLRCSFCSSPLDETHVFYEARAAQLCADSVLVSSRRGIDADEPAAAARLEAIRDCLRRGLSPEQMAARNGGLLASI